MWFCDKEKEKQKHFQSNVFEPQNSLFVLYCLPVEELEAQAAILWFGDSVGTKTLQGGSAVQIFSHGAFKWRQMEPEF